MTELMFTIFLPSLYEKKVMYPFWIHHLRIDSFVAIAPCLHPRHPRFKRVAILFTLYFLTNEIVCCFINKSKYNILQSLDCFHHMP